MLYGGPWKHIPSFYKEILIFYYDFIRSNEGIWNNCKICVNNKPCMFTLKINVCNIE